MTQYMKAPFNFVPLNNKVFFPDWASQISHDIPFEDGESGTIELELTAMTPIFVRNGHTQKDADEKNENYTSFSKDTDGRYFIPATSIKGMIRNVLEIMSFGKMRFKGKYPQKEIKDIDLKSDPFVSKHHLSNIPDLSDCILGHVDGDGNGESLRGRVHFSHAFCTNQENVSDLDLKKITLAEPKPSYYPIYIQQNEDKKNKGKVYPKYKSYEEGSSLKGWKRYPVHSNFVLPKDSVYKSKNEEDKQASKFIAIEGAKFNLKIRFHNLKKAEIGALISSITFHQTEKCYHSIGSAKSYGYGKLEVADIKINSKFSTTDYLKTFETSFVHDVEKKFEGFDLAKSQEIKELIVMAQNQNNKQDGLLEYMSLDKKDFKNAKDNKEFLQKYSVLSGVELKSQIGQKPATQEELIKIQEQLEFERLAKIEEKLKAEEEQIAIEKQKQKESEALLAEIARKKKQEKVEAQKRKEKQVEEGLAFLSDVNDFNASKKRIDQWMKKAIVKVIPNEQHQFLFDALTRFYNDPKNRDKKKWVLPFEQSHVWKKISTWVGSETARQWYNELIKN